MTSESSESDIDSLSSRRIHSNQIMLDLRQQVQNQERIIRSLVAERERLTRELDSRLFLVEAQLRREQKHIEAVITEKEQLIEFQAKQIYSLKQMLSEVSENQNHYQRNHRSSKRPLSKRYSVALDEYMNDHCTVSRALPVMVKGEYETKSIRHMKRNRARSLPELRLRDTGTDQQESCQRLMQNRFSHGKSTSHQQWCQLTSNDASTQFPYIVADAETEAKACCRHLPPVILDEISSRRWTSDCDSEHSDSLDSGISSPSIKSRNMHGHFESNSHVPVTESEKCMSGLSANNSVLQSPSDNPYNIFEPEFRNREILESGSQKPRRSSSIGNFINRTFSSSSSEKVKDNSDIAARRHSSFSGAEVKDLISENKPERTRYINSTNKTFGTNHRSVTKPRDIKFRKLFKFRRRTEPDPVSEDYMTV